MVFVTDATVRAQRAGLWQVEWTETLANRLACVRAQSKPRRYSTLSALSFG